MVMNSPMDSSSAMGSLRGPPTLRHVVTRAGRSASGPVEQLDIFRKLLPFKAMHHYRPLQLPRAG